jgi:hypothetical protein
VTIRDVLRYGIWAAVAVTANANRREYHMQTTWLPHLATNSLTLLLPEVIRLLIPHGKEPENLIGQVMVRMVRDNEDYVVYVAPLAAGYILSHPQYNIFKGELGDIRVVGLGLDAIPHSATGFALTAIICDTLETAEQIEPRRGPLARLVRFFNRSPEITSFGALAALTFFWEFAEYRVHNLELGLRGDISKINMMWSVDDTVRDVIANLLGWAAAVMLRRR